MNPKDFMKLGIATFICGILAYLLVAHTGNEPGQIEPKIAWAFFSGVFATKIVDFVFSSIPKRMKS